MKKLRLVTLVTGSFFLAAAGVLAACSDDDTVVTVTPDGGNDTGAPDVARFDADVPDTNVPDTAAPFDGGFKVQTFADTVADALCNTLTRCCFGQANVPDGGAVDGGSFDRGRCLRIYKDLGFEGSLVGEDEAMDNNIALDQTKSADCLSKINALQCNLSGADLAAARASCFGAISGTLANGQPCRASIECAPGHFCNPDSPDGGLPEAGADGGAAPVIGKCAPLRAQGGNCSIYETDVTDYNSNLLDSEKAEEACSYRGGGNTNLRCASYDFVGNDYKARAQWTCEPPVGLDAGCNSTVWCANGICDPTNAAFVCRSPVQYFQGACGAFVNP